MAIGDVTVEVINPVTRPGARFNGSTSKIEVPDVSIFKNPSIAARGFTISFWLNMYGAGDSSAPNLITKTANLQASAGFNLQWDASSLRFTFRIGVASAVNSATFLQSIEHQWLHIAVPVTVEGVGQFYINGNTSGNAAQTGVPSTITTTNPLTFGTNAAGSLRHLEGVMSDVRFYGRTLSAEEIAKIANQEDVREGLLGQWKLFKDTNDSIAGNNGTGTDITFINESEDTSDTFSDAWTGDNDVWIAVPIHNDSKIMMIHIEEFTDAGDKGEGGEDPPPEL